MKTLFKFTMLAAMLFCVAPESFAADIVVKSVKIKKRNSNLKLGVKYPQEDAYGMSDMIITTTTETSSKTENYTSFEFEFSIDPKNGAEVGEVTMEITTMDCNLKSATETIVCKPIGPAKFKAKRVEASSGACKVTLTGAGIVITNGDVDVAGFDAKLSGKEKGKDECDTKFKLKEVAFLTDHVSGYYVMNFSFAFDGKDLPNDAEMIVQLTDCKGNHVNINVKLSYDETTGVAMGGQAILQNKDCKWTMTYGEVNGANPCGEETTWALDFGQVKTSGAGTRTTAGSAQSGRPTLK